jgi:hypothetical protein
MPDREPGVGNLTATRELENVRRSRLKVASANHENRSQDLVHRPKREFKVP